ncbi:MAG TPA: hypothetical protein VJH65_04060 [Candidatus Nanoarchaeia archaeon]|nr:hypothetical protein [Candidatus Nanoarchaeia archaeon]
MINKKFLVYGIFLLVSIGFLMAQEELPSLYLGEAGEFVSGGVEITGSEGVLFEGFEGGGGTIKISGEGDPKVNINGNLFENLNPEGLNYIDINENGEITGAEFSVNENGGNYEIGTSSFYAPPNSRITFYGGEITILAEDNSEIKEVPNILGTGTEAYSTIISGTNLKLPGGHLLNQGKITFEKIGRSYVPKGISTEINGMNIQADSNTYIAFSDMQKSFLPEKENAIIFAPEEIIIKAAENKQGPLVSFLEEGNPIAGGKYFAATVNNGGSLNMKQDIEGNIQLTTSGDFAAYNGEGIVYEQNRKIITSEGITLPIAASVKIPPAELIINPAITDPNHHYILDPEGKIQIIGPGNENIAEGGGEEEPDFIDKIFKEVEKKICRFVQGVDECFTLPPRLRELE